MLDVTTDGHSLQLGPHFRVSFQRTLRIPDDGREYPLPPGLGTFPIHRIEDHLDRVPPSWRDRGGVFLPMYQREAMWLAFEADRPVAAQIGIGRVCAITGRRWRERLNRTPKLQNYVVCPDQPWLDGINAGEETIRQFVAMPLGMGYTVESQITGKEEVGGLQIRIEEARTGIESRRGWGLASIGMLYCCESQAGMGLAAGGRMTQKIYPDPHGPDAWDTDRTARAFVHILNSAVYRRITGHAPPPSPITAEVYTQHGFPWFELFDQDGGAVPPSEPLKGVKSIAEIDAASEKGADPADHSLEIPNWQKVGIVAEGLRVKGGEW